MSAATSDNVVTWRVGRHYGIHVYEGDRAVATFHRPEDADRAVAAVNAAPSVPQGADSGTARTVWGHGSATYRDDEVRNDPPSSRADGPTADEAQQSLSTEGYTLLAIADDFLSKFGGDDLDADAVYDWLIAEARTMLGVAFRPSADTETLPSVRTETREHAVRPRFVDGTPAFSMGSWQCACGVMGANGSRGHADHVGQAADEFLRAALDEP